MAERGAGREVTVRDGASSGKQSHAFGWRDAMDIPVKWRQLAEPNDQARAPGPAHSALAAPCNQARALRGGARAARAVPDPVLCWPCAALPLAGCAAGRMHSALPCRAATVCRAWPSASVGPACAWRADRRARVARATCPTLAPLPDAAGGRRLAAAPGADAPTG